MMTVWRIRGKITVPEQFGDALSVTTVPNSMHTRISSSYGWLLV